MFDGNKAKTKGAGNIRNQEDKDEKASSILEAIIEVNAYQDRDSNDKAVWDLGAYHVSWKDHGAIKLILPA